MSLIHRSIAHPNNVRPGELSIECVDRLSEALQDWNGDLSVNPQNEIAQNMTKDLGND